MISHQWRFVTVTTRALLPWSLRSIWKAQLCRTMELKSSQGTYNEGSKGSWKTGSQGKWKELNLFVYDFSNECQNYSTQKPGGPAIQSISKGVTSSAILWLSPSHRCYLITDWQTHPIWITDHTNFAQIGCAFSRVADSQSVGHFYNSKNIGASVDVCSHVAVNGNFLIQILNN